MKKTLFIAVIALFMIQCGKKADPFLIDIAKIGVLEKHHTVKQIDSIFANDSIVKRVAGDEFVSLSNDDLELYEKGGKHLLSLTPSEALDDNATITIVTIRDDRFKTAKGVGVNSTFKDFTTHYEVAKIERFLNNIIVEFKNQEFYVTIDIDQLPSQYEYDLSAKIEEASIPGTAKIKTLRLDWF